MTDRSSSGEKARTRRRWINFGEFIAVLAVAISALGLWKSWQSDNRPATVVVEGHRPIALTLRGKAQDDGRALEISPVEPSHALQSLTVMLTGGSTISLGSDGELAASDVESALGEAADRSKGAHRARARIHADYVEAGVTRTAKGNYVLTYRWEGGGLFGGKSLRLVSLSRG